MKTKPLPLLIITLALVLGGLAVLMLLGVVGPRVLPWGGALAGVLAVLQSLQLKTAAPRVRLVLFWAGLVTTAVMAAVALLG